LKIKHYDVLKNFSKHSFETNYPCFTVLGLSLKGQTKNLTKNVVLIIKIGDACFEEGHKLR